ncbi:hypothetical protein OE88DRAFT_1668006 [Heliocybe sulcata]|uniref:Uncharacterized protein n=1 Tax=Heliocybe sulcata TaxID=5364 RepID=A0A5C3MN10_9AGAM|nr:hypothetical protein OE88DRAFT_1668006 [Heliocybe sulcata]
MSVVPRSRRRKWARRRTITVYGTRTTKRAAFVSHRSFVSGFLILACPLQVNTMPAVNVYQPAPSQYYTVCTASRIPTLCTRQLPGRCPPGKGVWSFYIPSVLLFVNSRAVTVPSQSQSFRIICRYLGHSEPPKVDRGDLHPPSN